MLYHLWCFIPNKENIFSVDIDETDVVDVLKKEIKKKIPNMCAGVAADHLTLYRVTINKSLDQKKRMNELERLTQRLNECALLDGEQQLSDYFGGSPPGMRYYIFVQIPEVSLYGIGATCHLNTLERRRAPDPSPGYWSSCTRGYW